MGTFVDTVEDRIQNKISNKSITLKIKLAIRAINTSSGQNATSVMVNSERGEHTKITALLEKVSEKIYTLHVLKTNGETRNKSVDELNDLSVPGTQFDRPADTHHIATARTVQTNQIPEFLTERKPTPCNPETHQHQNLSTQISPHNIFGIVEQAAKNVNSETKELTNRLVEVIAGIATKQRPLAATMLKPVSTVIFFFDGKNENFELFDELYHSMLKMLPEMIESKKFNHFKCTFTKRSITNVQKDKCIKKKNSWCVHICISTKNCQTRITGYC